MTGPGFPRCPCPVHSWKRTVAVQWGCRFYTHFLLVSAELRAVSCAEGQWEAREGRERSFQEVFGYEEGVSLGLGQVSVMPCLELAVRSRKVWQKLSRGSSHFQFVSCSGNARSFPPPGISQPLPVYSLYITLLLLLGEKACEEKMPLLLHDNAFDRCGGLCGCVASGWRPANLQGWKR